MRPVRSAYWYSRYDMDAMMKLGIDREALAWSAGFFDGEGSVGCYDRSEGGAPRIIAQVAQVDPEVLHAFIARTNLSINIIGPFNPKTENSKPYYAMRVEGFEKVQNLFCSLWPWLGSEKKEKYVQAARKYLDWAATAKCQYGHSMIIGRKSHCPTCKSNAGKRSAEVRWG